MANTKSSKKDIRRTAKKTIRNRETRSALKTHIKKARVATTAGEAPSIQTALVNAVSALDKASQRGIIHKNQAARRKSRIAKAAAAALKNAGVSPTAPAAAEAKPKKAPVAKKVAPAATAEKKPAAKKPAAKKAAE